MADDGEGAPGDTASNALKRNLEYQRLIRAQIRKVDAARQYNHEAIQRAREAQQRASAAFPPQHLQRATGPVAGSATAKRMLIGSPEFIDNTGKSPPTNEDAARYREQRAVVPLIYRIKNWSQRERQALARGVRQQNMQLLANKLLEDAATRRVEGALRPSEGSLADLHNKMESIRSKPPAELEDNTTGVNWEQIQAAFVPGRSVADCRTQWLQTLDPRINHDPWTKEEDKMLISLAALNREHCWDVVSKTLRTNRTPAQCMQRFQRSHNVSLTRHGWTPSEDVRLRAAVRQFGDKNWARVADVMDGRTNQMCMHRWHSIDPDIKHVSWSLREDWTLILAVNAHGPRQWSNVQRYLPGRTGRQCRERYENVLNPTLIRGAWSERETALLWFAAAVCEPGAWTKVALIVGSRTDNQCWRQWRGTATARTLEAYFQTVVKREVGLVRYFGRRARERPGITVDDFAVVVIPPEEEEAADADAQQQGKSEAGPQHCILALESQSSARDVAVLERIMRTSRDLGQLATAPPSRLAAAAGSAAVAAAAEEEGVVFADAHTEDLAPATNALVALWRTLPAPVLRALHGRLYDRAYGEALDRPPRPPALSAAGPQWQLLVAWFRALFAGPMAAFLRDKARVLPPVAVVPLPAPVAPMALVAPVAVAEEEEEEEEPAGVGGKRPRTPEPVRKARASRRRRRRRR